jgi:guanine nucleotide-binding protein subunit alpha, other
MENYSSDRSIDPIQQMRGFHSLPFSAQEIEGYRQQIFNNLTHGLRYTFEQLPHLSLEVSDENLPLADMINSAEDIRDGEPYPTSYLEPLRKLWADPAIQQAWARRNEVALPEKCAVATLEPPRLA